MKHYLSVMILILSTTCLLCGCHRSEYKEAESLLAAGNYEEARQVYQMLVDNGGYKDSAIKIQECNYIEAESLLASGNYEEARQVYQMLVDGGGYKDSAEKIQECNYIEAEIAFNSEDYTHAYDLFINLGNYKDSYNYSLNLGYTLANQFAENENYAEATRLFLTLGNYKESESLLSECTSRMLENASIGDIIYYGKYEQDGNIENGSEPLTWIVLGTNGDNIILLSEYIIEKMPFGSNHYWESSDVREWLNNDFLNQAFSSDEKSMIQKMITSNKTEDMVFLLSAEEARGFFASDDSRVAYITAYMEQMDFNGYDSKGTWWTRSISTASNGKGVVTVETSGNVRSAGCAPDVPNQHWSADIGVRPVIALNISGNTIPEAQNISIFGYDSSRGLDNEPDKWSNKSYGSSGGKCIVCNGTGYVIFYYGSSDLEALLSGHDPYTFVVCSSCGGTGKN